MKKRKFVTKDPNNQKLLDQFMLRLHSLGMNDFAYLEIMEDMVHLIDESKDSLPDHETFCKDIQENGLQRNSLEWCLYSIELVLRILVVISFINFLLYFLGFESTSAFGMINQKLVLDTHLFLIECIILSLVAFLIFVAKSESFKPNKKGTFILLISFVMLPILSFLLPSSIIQIHAYAYFFLIGIHIGFRLLYFFYSKKRYADYKKSY